MNYDFFAFSEAIFTKDENWKIYDFFTSGEAISNKVENWRI
jgi:hypothetical protein